MGILATATIHSDDDGGCILPCMGYDKATLLIHNSQAGTVHIEVDLTGLGGWQRYDTVTLAAGVLQTYIITGSVGFIRLRVVQGGVAGILNSTLFLSP